jgi:hypothetical protein
MKKSELKQLIKEEIKQLIKEEIDIASILTQYFKENPFTTENQWKHDYNVLQYIKDKIDRPLTPSEKGKITRMINKYRNDFWGRRWREKSDAEDKIVRDRYQNNLLPLTVDNGSGRPDSTYYELANTYYDTDNDGNTRISYSDSKSGYTDYKLKKQWINEPVDKATLDQYWHSGTLAMAGVKKPKQ